MRPTRRGPPKPQTPEVLYFEPSLWSGGETCFPPDAYKKKPRKDQAPGLLAKAIICRPATVEPSRALPNALETRNFRLWFQLIGRSSSLWRGGASCYPQDASPRRRSMQRFASATASSFADAMVERVDRDMIGKSARLAYIPAHQLDHCQMGTMSYPRYCPMVRERTNISRVPRCPSCPQNSAATGLDKSLHRAS
jgi:hypothetical protein